MGAVFFSIGNQALVVASAKNRSGASVSVWSDAAKSTAVTLPVTLSADVTYYLNQGAVDFAVTLPDGTALDTFTAKVGNDGEATVTVEPRQHVAALAAGIKAGSGTYAPRPTGTPTVGQVPVVSTVSPLVLGWGSGGGGASVFVGAPTGTAATDVATIQAAHDALPSTGGQLLLQAGTYALGTTGLSFSKPVKLVGAGSGGLDYNGQTLLTFDGTTGSAITVTANGCTFQDFALVNTQASPTAGSGLQLTAGVGVKMDRIKVAKFYDNIVITTGSYYTLANSMILDPVRYGLYQTNTINGDEGECAIFGNSFLTWGMTRDPASAYRWESGGGVKFFGNKINGGAQQIGAVAGCGHWGYGIDFRVADGINTADLFVTANGVENCRTYGIFVGQLGPSYTGTVQGIMIQENEVQFPVGGAGTDIVVTATSGGQNKLTNVISRGNYASTINYVQITNGLIEGNTLTGLSNALSVTYSAGIAIGRNVFTAAQGTAQIIYNGGDQLSTYTAPLQSPVARQVLEREIPPTTSSSTYSTLYRIVPASYTGGIMTVSIACAVGNKGSAVKYLVRGWAKENGAVTLTTIGTDYEAGFVGGAAAFDYLLDVAAVSGEIQVKVRQNATNAGSGLQGRVTVVLDGSINTITRS